MNLTGKTTIFCKEVGKDKIKIFETSINHKEGEEYKDNVTIRVNFAKDFLPDEKKNAFKDGYAYPMELIEAILSTRGYTRQDGKHVSEVSIMVFKAKTVGAPKQIQKKEKPAEETIAGTEDLPF